jgi:hypothetical protein
MNGGGAVPGFEEAYRRASRHESAGSAGADGAQSEDEGKDSGQPEAGAASLVVRRFREALYRSLDAGIASPTGPAVTTDGSDWRIDTCGICRHTFRLGDRVWLETRDGRIKAVHDSAELPCHADIGLSAPLPPQPSPAVQRFGQAACLADPGIAGLKTYLLRPGHPLLSERFSERRKCRGCDKTFRPYDRVAFCPCQPLSPACHLAAHRDPATSQLCFDMLADPQRGHCLVTLAKLRRQVG